MISSPKRASVVSRSGRNAVTGSARRPAPRAMRSSTAARGSEPEFGSAAGQPRINSTVAGSRPAGSAGGRFRVAADDDRHRFRDRLRIAADLVEFHELAREAGPVAGPQGAHGRDI